ncbi:MAG: ankyrin repeat domain-containing protein [Candidatus Goldiibacteriota bacterium]|jgi:ankyrin repeat protein
MNIRRVLIRSYLRLKKIFPRKRYLIMTISNKANIPAERPLTPEKEARRMSFLENEFVSSYESGNLQAAKKLLCLNINLNQVTHSGISVICDAVSNGYFEFAGAMMDAGASPHFSGNITGTRFMPPLHYAAFKNNAGFVKKIMEHSLKTMEINDIRMDYKGISYAAAVNGSADTLKALLDYGFHPDSHPFEGDMNVTALSEIAREYKWAKGNKKCDFIRCIKMLIEYGADVNSLDPIKRSPLHVAAYNDAAYPVAEMLLAAGAKVDLLDGSGETALYIAVKYGASADFFSLLLENGADVNNGGSHGNYPLMNAVISKNMELVKFFIEKGANVNVRNKKGLTPLMMAAKRGLVEMSRFLLSAGADAYIMDKTGKTVFDMPLPEKMKETFVHMGGKNGD